MSLSYLQAKKEQIFAQVNELHTLANKITDFDSRINEIFLVKSVSIDAQRMQFEKIVDDINALQIERASDAKPYLPDVQVLRAFDDLYHKIKFVREKITAARSAPTAPTKETEPKIASIKLPPIELPTFDGKIEHWPRFYESFKANIHNNQHLTDEQRVQYLVGNLTNSALKVAAGLVPSGATYKIIWDSLVQKYQDVRALATSYLNNILDVKACTDTASSIDNFVEKIAASVLALRQLDIPDLCDFILLHCAIRKLDLSNIQAFEKSVAPDEMPTFAELIAFLRNQVKVLERSSGIHLGTNSRVPNTNSVSKRQQPSHPRSVYNAFVANGPDKSIEENCKFCKRDGHWIAFCKDFEALQPVKSRVDYIINKRGCTNCLSMNHYAIQCRSRGVCQKCRGRHHTLLHYEDNKWRNRTPVAAASGTIARADQAPETSGKDAAQMPTNSSVAMNTAIQVNANTSVLLATAQVFAKSNMVGGSKLLVRCLIDNGSQSHLITLDCCKKLNLSISPVHNSVVKGIGSSSRPIHGFVSIQIESRIYSQHRYNLRALVVDSITEQLPTHSVVAMEFKHLKGIPLADLSWNVPGNIDMVLGAQLFPHIYFGDKIERSSSPVAVSTAFGYVLMGDCPVDNCGVVQSVSALALSDLLQQFWQLEEATSSSFLSPEDTECENQFRASVSRDGTGRYIVALPFSRSPTELGSSAIAARRRFMSLERKFNLSPDLRKQYNAVIQEYIDKGYLMKGCDSENDDSGYYIPHHAVVRADKPMPRVVLDASAKTHTGLSLNDILRTGPNLQTDLFDLLINFRLFPVAMTADIAQMYLQIMIPKEYQKYLKIFFRFSSAETLSTYKFCRLPFGLKSSPFLAMRVIRQLAEDARPHFPEAAEVAAGRLYMDDLVHSMPDEQTASQLSEGLIRMFGTAKFDLVKWSSNSSTLLRQLPETHVNMKQFGDDFGSKVLGTIWRPAEDMLAFTLPGTVETCTKRGILSTVARLFDVLGLVSPVILYAKLLIKELWLSRIDWDEIPPDSIVTRFTRLITELPLLADLSIPRHVGVWTNSTVRLVAFCDASMNAYGCSIYVHSTSIDGNTQARLLCAKSKVSPTKIITLARLELCAAVLLSRLIRRICEIYKDRIAFEEVYAFSDSTIALSWIHSSPHRWSVFVSNRVAQCQENLNPERFFHIAGEENPSDCLSRGLLPSQIMSHKLWWSGPQWMQGPVTDWPIRPFKSGGVDSIPEAKSSVSFVAVSEGPSVVGSIADRVSSWGKLLRVMIYVLRFLRSKSLTLSDVENLFVAERIVIREVQLKHFRNEIEALSRGSLPSPKMRRLSAFVDEHGILRVGGRLKNSSIPFEAKHPVLLPKCDRVVELIIRHYHESNCHTGAGLVISLLRQRYWILDCRSIVRAIVRRCNRCFHSSPSHLNPAMADLPVYRVQEAKAFVHTGVDYAGPLQVTMRRGRGIRSQKAYLCLFVCLVTKAIHLELVSALTTEAFLLAFSRFISRRGPVSVMYSDNGTNFIGAKTQLGELYDFMDKEEFRSSLHADLSERRIEWRNIPPRAPHFGGMWEANVKSVKTHLYRVIGAQILSFEEMSTVLAQIECLLNSRPLTLLSSDPEVEALTPAHFLMASPLKHLPLYDLPDAGLTLSDRKRMVDAMVVSFWRRWRVEYLHTLQVRHKWTNPGVILSVGTVVLLMQENCPPLYWPLGIVVAVFPGGDGVVRVAEVKTAAGIFRRPTVKLCPLPQQ